MKKKILLSLICVLFAGWTYAQEKLEVPALTVEQKQEVLYNHVIAYAGSGISYAKSQDVSPKEYGHYVGKLFTSFWDSEGGLMTFAGGMMYILSGIHPQNEMQIIKQSEQVVIFQLKNVDFPFQNGPLYGGVTYEEYLEFSEGVISTLATHMKLSFSQDITPDNWYKVILKVK